MAVVSYPASLPSPQAITHAPTERRQLSDPEKPREARPLQRDRLATEQITFAPFTSAQAAVFRAWWETALGYGGSWFVANWRTPRGSINVVRRFLGPPRWDYVAAGIWRVSGVLEVRGVGEFPQYEADPDFDKVVLLMHMEGDSFVDSSSYGRALSTVGVTGTSAAQKLMGERSGYFPGPTSRVVTSSSPELSSGVQAYAVEFAVLFTSLVSSTPFASTRSYFLACKDTAADNDFTILDTGTLLAPYGTSASGLTTGEWYTIKSCRSETGDVKLFVNGVIVSATNSPTPTGTSGWLEIGSNSSHAGIFSGGGNVYIDEFRYTIGTDRGQVNYTPSTKPFPNRGP